MRNFVRNLQQKEPRIGSSAFEYYKPDFTELKELYRVNDEPINIINNSENVPFIQNVAQQQLVDISTSGLDTSGLSDKQLADTIIPRYVEVNEIADASRNALEDTIKSISNIQNQNNN